MHIKSYLHSFLIIVSLIFSSQACTSSSSGKSITITDPTPETQFTLDDDKVPNTDFFEINVTVVADGFSEDESLSLFINRDENSVDDQTASTTTVNADGSATFSNVPLRPGDSHDIQVCGGEGCSVSSAVLTIRIPELCPTINFVVPDGNRITVIEDPTEPITLGGSGDAQCNEVFEHTFNVSLGDGTNTSEPARIFVNGSNIESSTVAITNRTAIFEEIALPKRGLNPADKNTARVEVRNNDGVLCSASLENIFVDCEGPSCAITAPNKSILSSADDTNDELDGFQTQIQVTSDDTGNMQPVQIFLALEGDEEQIAPNSSISELEPNVFGVSIEQTLLPGAGTYSVHAICRDEIGNEVPSPTVQWTVDVATCDLEILTPTADQEIVHIADMSLFVDQNDENDDVDEDPENGTQISVTGSFGESPCTDIQEVRVGMSAICDDSALALDTFESATIAEAKDSWNHIVTLASQIEQSLCVIAIDNAGNASFETVAFTLRSDAPQLQIDVPPNGLGINKNGTPFGIENPPQEVVADEIAPNTEACELEFTIQCSEIGYPIKANRTRQGVNPQPVDIKVGPIEALEDAENNEVICEANPNAGEQDLPGIASFVLVTPSNNSAPHSVDLSIVHTHGRIQNQQTISVFSDCSPPTAPSFLTQCNNLVIQPSQDDEDLDTEGLQYNFELRSLTGIDRIEITNEQNESIAPPEENGDDGVGNYIYLIDFAENIGAATIKAYSADTAGNERMQQCSFLIGDLPEFEIQDNRVVEDTFVISEADAPCDEPEGEGLSIRFSGNTDASIGSIVTLTLGNQTFTSEVVAGQETNTFEICFFASEGKNQSFTVSVDDITETNGIDDQTFGTRTNPAYSLSVDTTPPESRITDLTWSTDNDDERRAGIVTFAWTGISDSDGALLSRYEIRCSEQPITADNWNDENIERITWNTGNADRGLGNPPTPTENQDNYQATVGGFTFGKPSYCAIRGYDIVNLPSPWGDDGPVTDEDMVLINTAIMLEFDAFDDTALRFGKRIVPLGDINGDGLNDFMVTASGGGNINGKAFVYFGTDDANTPIQLGFEIQGTQPEFGTTAESIGDYNNDGRPDFAISDFNPTVGLGVARVYVFFGRSDEQPWPDLGSPIQMDDGFGAYQCNADLCYETVNDPADFNATKLGISISGTDFNNDGISDIALGDTVSHFELVAEQFLTIGQTHIFLGGEHHSIVENSDNYSPRGFTIEVPRTSENIDQVNMNLAAEDDTPERNRLNGFIVSYPFGIVEQGGALSLPEGEIASFNTNAVIGSPGNVDENPGGDLIIGANGATVTGVSYPSYLFFLSGRAYPDGSIGLVEIEENEVTILREDPLVTVANRIAFGDYNGDGWTDLSTSSSRQGQGGRLEIYFGVESELQPGSQGMFNTTPVEQPAILTVINNAQGAAFADRFATPIANNIHPVLGDIGDLNQDNEQDLMFGSSIFRANGEASNGAVSIFMGREDWTNPNPIDGESATTFSHTQADCIWMSGSIVSDPPESARPAFVGDLNGDGWNDIAIGYPDETITIEAADVQNAGRFLLMY